MSREQDIYNLIQESKTTELQILESEYFRLKFDDAMNSFTIRDKETNAVVVIGDYRYNHLTFAAKNEALIATVEESFNTVKPKGLDNLIKDAKDRKDNAPDDKDQPKDKTHERE